MNEDLNRIVALRSKLFETLVERLGLDPRPDLDHFRRTLMQLPGTTLLRWFFSVTDIADTELTALLARMEQLPVLPDENLVVYPDAASYYARFVSAEQMNSGWIPLLTNGPFLYVAHYDPYEPLPDGLPPLVGTMLVTSEGYENLRSQWLPLKKTLKVGGELSPNVRHALMNPPATASDLAAGVWLKTLGLPSDPASVHLLLDSMNCRMVRFPLRKLDLDFVDIGVSRESLGLLKVFPFHRLGSLVFVATENPDDQQVLESLRMKVDSEIEVVCAPVDSATLGELWARVIDREKRVSERQQFISLGQLDARVASGAFNDEDVSDLMQALMKKVAVAHASDLHFEPCRENTLLRVRMRMDGELYQIHELPMSLGKALMTRIKVGANVNITDNRKPQDGRMAVVAEDRRMDVRVAVMPMGEDRERIVLRILDGSTAPNSLESLNFPAEDLARFKQALASDSGLVAVSGPTGCGKSTTLYTAIQSLNKPGVSVVTVEDPVEYRIEGIQQQEVREAQGLTFPVVLRSLLRMDPDYILVGEIRDEETADTAVRAGNSGHLVLTTLHANDALASLTRFVDLKVPHYMIADTGRLFVAQRLIRRLCRSCRVPRGVTATERAAMEEAGYTEEQLPDGIYSKKGCPACFFSGYSKRFAVVETLEMNPGLREEFIAKASRFKLLETAKENGFRPMFEAGLGRVLLGDTSYDEVAPLQVRA